MKDQHDLRHAPRMTQIDHYKTQYTVVKNHVMIQKFVSLELQDLSFQGIGVLTDEPLPLDMLMNFDVFFDGKLYNVSARVQWTKRLEDKYRSGLAFEDIPDELIANIKAYLTDFQNRKYHS